MFEKERGMRDRVTLAIVSHGDLPIQDNLLTRVIPLNSFFFSFFPFPFSFSSKFQICNMKSTETSIEAILPLLSI